MTERAPVEDPEAVRTLELRVEGMDCPSCAGHVRDALCSVEGVRGADILLAAGKAVVEVKPEGASADALARAVEGAGYRLASGGGTGTGRPGEARGEGAAGEDGATFARKALAATGLAFGVVLFVVVVGEWLDLFQVADEAVPFPVGVLVVLLVGWPPFRSVALAALRGKVIAHTLMALGVVAALVVGQWVTAAVVALFMRVGDAVERFTVSRGRQAVLDLERLAPDSAERERADGGVEEVEVSELAPGDVVLVRPGQRIPADGEVLTGHATVEEAAITGESMPAEVGPGRRVFGATVPRGGALRVRVERTGSDSTFGRILRMVEEAEGARGRTEQFADRFSGYYLPVVAAVAAGTYLASGDALATAAVLVVACSCAFALATPVAMLATIGAAARGGLLVKGGRFVEALERPGILLLDKTGTVSLGRPLVTDVTPLRGVSEEEVLRLAASAEALSEHPLARGVVEAARGMGLEPDRVEAFRSVEGRGVEARVASHRVWVGGAPPVSGDEGAAAEGPLEDPPDLREALEALEAAGRTCVRVYRDGKPVGVLGLTDVMRPDVGRALKRLRELGVERIEMLTGDRMGTALSMASELGIDFRAELLPEDKVRVVEEYQAQGLSVVMVGDGVNDAPALAAADVGIAMGATGTDLALEVADVALLRDDWSLLPDAVERARRTMGIVRGNFAFTAVYNLVGLTLAATGILPPIAAAAAQSIPDLGILGNSARLLGKG